VDNYFSLCETSNLLARVPDRGWGEKLGYGG
jgi:hypothetical protein